MKYYLIEKYTEYEDRPCSKYTRWDVKEYKTKAELEKAVLQGPKRGGTLIAAKGLELKVLILESGKEDCSESDFGYYGR